MYVSNDVRIRGYFLEARGGLRDKKEKFGKLCFGLLAYFIVLR